MVCAAKSVEVVKIVFVPGLTDFLGTGKKAAVSLQFRGELVEASQLVLTTCFRPWNRFRAIVVLE